MSKPTPPLEATPFEAAPPDLRIREMLEAVRSAPYRDPAAVIGQHARSVGLDSQEFVRIGVEQDVDVLDYARRVREGEDVDALLESAARRGVVAVEKPEQRAVRETGRRIAREAIRQLVDPTSKVSLKLTAEERTRRVHRIQQQLLPALKIVTGPEEKEVEAALKAGEPGRIALTGEQLMRAAGLRESEKFAALGGTAEEDIAEVVRGAEAGAVAARQVIEQKLKDSPILQRMDEFDDRRFGSLSFIRGRVDELAKQRGLTDAQAKAEGKDYELERKKLAVEAVRDLAMARTAGLWTGPMFLPRELHVDGDESLWAQLQTAFTPNLEVLGLDEKGDVIFRQESPWEYVFGLLDVPLEATAGVVGGAVRGEISGAPFTPELARSVASAALRGVGERESFSGLAMESPAAQAGAVGALALGAGGLALDILFPLDVPVIAAKGAVRLKVGAKAEKLLTTVARRSAAGLLEEARDGHVQAIAAWRRGQMDEALALWDEAGHAEGRLREEFKAADMGKSIDRADAEIASKTGAGMGFARAARALPGDLGVDRVGTHMSERRRVLERRVGKKVTTTVAQPGVEEYNPAISLRKLIGARKTVAPLARDVGTRRAAAVARVTRNIRDPDMAARAARTVEQSVQKRARPAFVATFPTPSPIVTDEARQLVREVTRSLGKAAVEDRDAGKMLIELSSDASLRALWTDPWAWFDSWKARRGDPSGWSKLFDEAGEVAAADEPRKRARYDFIKALLRVRDVAIRAGDPEQVLAVIDKAAENLVLSSESRSRAAHILADMARKGLTKGDPEELRKMAAEELERRKVAAAKPGGAAAAPPASALSAAGKAFARSVEATFRVSAEEADAIARVLDARAETVVASGADASVEAWWEAQKLEVRRAVLGELPADPRTLFQRDAADLDVPEVWYSALRRSVEAKLPNRASPDQILNTIRKTPGVKAEELEWTELGRWLEEKKAAGVGSIEKDDVLRFLDEHAVRVEEVWKGSGTSPKMVAAQDVLADAWKRAQARYERFIEANKGAIDVTEAKIRRTADEELTLRSKRENVWADIERILERTDALGFDSPGEAATAIRKYPDWRDRWPGTDITEAEEAAIQQYGRMGADLGRLRAELSALRVSDPYRIAHEAARVVSLGGLHLAQAGNRAEIQNATRRVLFAEDEEQVTDMVEIIRREAGEASGRWSRYILPGKMSNYRELLLRLPTSEAMPTSWVLQQSPHTGLWGIVDEAGSSMVHNASSPEDARAQALRVYGPSLASDYHSPHWDEPNILAHVRMTDRVTTDGKRVLHVEEVQSDWHQAGRVGGYAGQPLVTTAEGLTEQILAGRPGGPAVPDAPFKKSWPDLALKRVLRIAADKGYDGVTWNTGERVQRIVGGEVAGQAHFYDTMLPSSVKHLAKETPITAKLPAVPDAVHYLPLTPAVKQRTAAPQALFQVAEGGPKASILFREGRAVITAFEKGDISSIVHETGHLFRRDLERAAIKLGADSQVAMDLKALSEWAGAKAGVWDVAAEEKVARAFERYLYDGKAPTATLGRVFAAFRDFMRRIYGKLRGSPLAGQMTPEVRGVFDRMLGAPVEGVPREPPVPPRRPIPPAMPPSSPEEALAEAERAIQATPLPVVSKAHAVGEQTFTESLRNVLEGPGKLRAAVRFVGINTMFGGDAWRSLRELPVRIRDSVMAGVRTAEHGINDAVSLVRETASSRDPTTLHRFLDGEQVTFRDGRAVPSSGWNAAQSVARRVRDAWDTMSEDAQNDLLPLLLEEMPNLNALPRKQQERIDRAVVSLLGGTLPATKDVPPLRFMQDLSQSLERLPKAVPGASRVVTPKEFELVRGVLRWAGVQVKPSTVDDIVEAVPEVAAEDVIPDVRASGLLDLVGRLYGARDQARTAVLLAAHGHAARAQMLWTGLLPGLDGDALGVSKGAAEAFMAWTIGKRVPPNRISDVRRLVEKFGINPYFVDEPLLGGKVFLPEPARQALADAISHGVERFDPQFSWDEAQTAGFLPAVLRYIKLRMTRGAIFIRPRYYLMNTFDHFNQLAIQPEVGIRPALISTLRILPQTLFTVVPGGARLFYASQRLTEAAVRAGMAAPTSAPGRFILDRGNVERLRTALQSGGDRVAHAVARLLGGAKYHVSVNDVLDGGAAARAQGRPDRITLGMGKYAREYTYEDLRRIASQEGAFATFDVSQLSNVIRGKVISEAERLRRTLPRKAWDGARGALQDFMSFTTEMGEAWAERERLGAMVTLMEAGMTPQDAARITVRALYDYAGSMTKADRHLLVGLTLPFWAYHKNVNMQVVNSMLSPKGAWINGVIRRAHQLGPRYLSDAIYAATVDPYGVDVDAMSLEGQASYWTLRHIVENGMGPPESWPVGIREQLEAGYGPVEEWSEDVRDFAVNGYKGYDNVPPDVRAALHAIFAAEKTVIRQGDLYELGTWAQRIREMQTQPGAVPPPDPSARRRYYRSAGGITFPIPPSTSPWVSWYYQDVGKDYPYTEMFLPESSIVAGMRHVSGALATWALLGQFVVESTGAFDPVDPQSKIEAEEGMAAVQLRNALYEVIEPTRTPIMRDFFALLGVDDAPKKVAPIVAQIIQGILPLALEPKMETADPLAPPVAQVTEEKRYFLPPGAVSLAFELVPGFAEMNAILLAMDKAPLEERAKLQGDLLLAARMVGLQTAESSYGRTFKAERPRFDISVTTPQARAPVPK